jgi:hypothetical protein
MAQWYLTCQELTVQLKPRDCEMALWQPILLVDLPHLVHVKTLLVCALHAMLAEKQLDS